MRVVGHHRRGGELVSAAPFFQTRLKEASEKRLHRFFLKPLLRCFGEQPLICLGLSTALASQIMYISFTSHFIIMVVQNWVSGFNVLLGVCVSGLVSKFARGDEQGFALGTLAAVQSIVSVLGPAIFGGLYGWAAPKGGVSKTSAQTSIQTTSDWLSL